MIWYHHVANNFGYREIILLTANKAASFFIWSPRPTLIVTDCIVECHLDGLQNVHSALCFTESYMVHLGKQLYLKHAPRPVLPFWPHHAFNLISLATGVVCVLFPSVHEHVCPFISPFHDWKEGAETALSPASLCQVYISDPPSCLSGTVVE